MIQVCKDFVALTGVGLGIYLDSSYAGGGGNVGGSGDKNSEGMSSYGGGGTAHATRSKRIRSA